LPRDYDEWAAMGGEGWSWKDVLPYFRKLERDLDFGSDQTAHGDNGPLPIRRIAAADWPAFGRAFAQGLRATGLPELRDQNAEFGDGYFPSAFSNENDRRATTATAYLDEATRWRPNLSIFSGLHISRLLMDAHGARGVEAVRKDGGAPLRINAREVIVCAGALQTPGLLLRAGIGDGEGLRRLGISCVRHLPGVGH
jgi:5-(hydroxymethyl)furfural/furfural oxidase